MQHLVTIKVPPSQLPIFELTEEQSDGGNLYTVNAAGLVAMHRLLEQMMRKLKLTEANEGIPAGSVMRMTTPAFSTDPKRDEPWVDPVVYFGVALSDPENVNAAETAAEDHIIHEA
jgi:hypothetical protein